MATPDDIRRFLVSHHGLDRWHGAPDAQGCRALLARMRCIQLDPLDRIGTNADLVAMARIPGLTRGAIYEHLFPGGAFEHLAKQRCLLPPHAFPWYRTRADRTDWWSMTERKRRIEPDIVEAVFDEIAAHGPCSVDDLTDHGRVEAIDWSGWKGTGRAATMAVEVLWAHCRVVVCGRTASGDKRYDIPERALADVADHDVDAADFPRWAVRERVEAAGLLPRADGPWWSLLHDVRRTPVVDEMLADGELVEVRVDGSRRPHLAPPDWQARTPETLDDDGVMRILGPLDPLLWDRKLLGQVFDFDYVWEVYVPPARRRWGYYVCPLLHHGRLVGRFEGRLEPDGLRVLGLWPEDEATFDRDAFAAALADHAARCGTVVAG